MDTGVHEMKTRFIFIILSLVIASQSYANNDDTYESLSTIKIITAKEISNSGLTRVGDILLLVDEWVINTIDGYDWSASVNGLTSFKEQNWIIMLDNRRMDFNSFDVKNLNMLPISIDQVDSVEIVSVPQIYNGEFTDRGLIHIHTFKPRHGFSIRGYFSAGNETGDPGPYKYTELSTPNVDRIGQDGSFGLDYRYKNFYTSLSTIFQEHIYTDFAMRRRIHSSTLTGWGHKERVSPALKLGFETSEWKNEVFICLSNSQKYFLFFEPFGREVPLNNIFTHIGLSGNFNITGNDNLIYRTKYSTHELEKCDNKFDFDFNWKLHNLSANLEYTHRSRFFQSELGIGFDRFNLDTGYHLEKKSYYLSRIYSELSYKFSDRVYQNLGTMLIFSNDRIGFKTSLTSLLKITSAHSFKTIISFSQRLFKEDNSLWYWTEQGYNLLNNQNIEYKIGDNFENSDQVTADLIWESKFSNLTVKFSGCYRSFNNLYLEKQAFLFNKYDCSCFSSMEIHTKNKGQILSGQVSIKHNFSPKLSHQFFYSCRTAITGDDLFKDVWATIPHHKISCKINYTPVENLSIWAMLTYFSSSFWVDYDNIDGETCTHWNQLKTTYYSAIKGAEIIDLQIRKRFWHRKIAASLITRNVWNQKYRYHPIGASFDLSFLVKLRFYFNFS